MFLHILLIIIYNYLQKIISTCQNNLNPAVDFLRKVSAEKLTCWKKMSEGSTNTIWTCSGISEPGLRGGGPSVAERALDGSRYRERGAHTEPECCRRDWPKKPEDDGGNAWRGVFSPAPLSGCLAARSAAARLLPCYCYDVEARSACSSNLPLHRDLRRNHRRWQPGFRDRNWTPRDPASLSTLLYCFVGVIAHPELSRQRDRATQCDARNASRKTIFGRLAEKCLRILILIFAMHLQDINVLYTVFSLYLGKEQLCCNNLIVEQ